MNAKAESAARKILGALVLSGSFLGAFALLARAQRADAADAFTEPTEESAPSPRPVEMSKPLPGWARGEPLPGETAPGAAGRADIVDVESLTAAIVAEGDAPGPDSALGRPPRATRLFSGKLDADGTRMYVYETQASAKDTYAWAAVRSRALSLDDMKLSAGDKSGQDEEGAAAPTRRVFGGREGRLVVSVKDEGHRRVVTLVALGDVEIKAAAGPRERAAED